MPVNIMSVEVRDCSVILAVSGQVNMSRFRWVIGLLAVSIIAGCHSDIVCTRQLAAIEHKCVHIEPIESENPYVGQVLRDVLEKEFIRKNVQMCDANSATVFITGSTFMTLRSSPDAGSLGSRKSAAANQAIESISITATDSEGADSAFGFLR